MDFLNRLCDLIKDEGVDECRVRAIERTIRREYGGSDIWLAKHTEIDRKLAIDTFLKTGSAKKAAEVSGFAVSNVYRLLRNYRRTRWGSLPRN